MNYKKEAKSFWSENQVVAAGTPDGHDGDTAYGYCEATGEMGSTVLMSFVDAAGEVFEAEILEPIALELYGLAGAF